VAVWNVRGICDEGKRMEVVDVFKRGKFDVLGLCETNLKGREDFVWNDVHGVRSGREGAGRGKEGVAVLLSDEWYKALVAYKCICSRVMWVKFKFDRVKVCLVVAYGPVNDRSDEEKVRFWNDLGRAMNEIGNGYRVIVMGDLNGWVGDRVVKGIVGPFGVPGLNDSGERVMDFCAERELCIANTFFKHKDIHKFTFVGRARGGVNKSMIDYVMVRKEMLRDVCDVLSVRGLGGGLSDHMIVLCKMRMKGVWLKQQRRTNDAVRIKSERLREEMYKNEYVEGIQRNSGDVNTDVEVEQLWTQVKSKIVGCAREVCGCSKTGRRKKGSEWWSDEVKKGIEKKEDAWKKVLQSGGQEIREQRMEEYKRVKKEVKMIVRKSKKEANENMGKRMTNDMNGNIKLFWKEVKKARGCVANGSEKVKDASGRMLLRDNDVKERWKEYFEELLNVEMQDQIVVNEYGLQDLNRSEYLGCEAVRKEEVVDALGKLKNGKASGVDEVTAEMLKIGDEYVEEWVWKLCAKAFECGRVPEDWKNAVIVPLYKGKGERSECKNYRGISLLSVVGKVYARVLMERVRRITEGLMDDEQGGFRKGRGCVDQIFAVKQVCEKVLEKGKNVYLGFMDLEKAYDRVNREALWQVLRMYGVRGKLLNGIKSMYEESKACVRVKGQLSAWFEIKSGVRQGCVMSPWLFNVFMDAVMKEVRMGTRNIGVRLEVNGNEWRVSDLLYADDVVFMSETEAELRSMIECFNNVSNRRGLRVNASKSKVMVVGKGEGVVCQIDLNGQTLEQVNEFKYLGCVLNARGTDEADCGSKVVSGRRTVGAIRSLVNARSLSMSVVKVLHEKLLVPVLMYGSETMVWKEKERSKIRAVQMDSLRGVIGVKRVDRMRSERIREMCGITKAMDELIDESVLRWYGHVERMGDERLVHRVYVSEGVGRRSVGRPRKRWKDNVWECVRKRGMSVNEAERMVHDRQAWRGFVRGNAWGLARG